MGDDHLVLDVDRLVKPVTTGETVQEMAGPSRAAEEKVVVEEEETEDEEAPLITLAECRICQDEDSIQNLETPCACSGSLKVFFFILTHSHFLLGH